VSADTVKAAPRLYVTGESLESAARSVGFLVKSEAFPWELESMSQLSGFLDLLPSGKNHNAARCALELALMDARGEGTGPERDGVFSEGLFLSKGVLRSDHSACG